MFSRWVTSTYSPPDDVMSSNCDLALSVVAEESRAEQNEERNEGRDGRGVGHIHLNLIWHSFLTYEKGLTWTTTIKLLWTGRQAMATEHTGPKSVQLVQPFINVEEVAW